jgi:UDP-N-acetylglucosamine--N-acetylmuramyl-(pentapeptide) pyrophosphoryl-undecaprenol N-acetylglucosamine transferase
VVLHVAGDAGMPAAEASRDRLPEPQRGRYRPVPFIADGMAEALVAADLVLGRAGSSTCAEVAAAGVAAILVPYPYAGAHQYENAAWLAGQRAAVVVPDAELDAERLLRELRALRDDDERRRMADAARTLGRPQAAAEIAAELIRMGSRAA